MDSAILNKWKKYFTANCKICNGTGIYNNNECKCVKQAKITTQIEQSNIPLTGIQQNFNLSKYNLQQYIKSVTSNSLNKKNLYLYKFPYKLNNYIILQIARNLVQHTNPYTQERITVRYDIFENLIQQSLKNDSNIYKELMYSITFPDVLFVDGIGTETGFQATGKNNIKLLHLILKERHNRCKSTVISSNLSIQEIQNNYSRDIINLLYDFIYLRH